MKNVLKNNIRLRRTELNITQQDLANQVESTRQTIISIEKGNYNPSIKLALLIAKALNCDINYIFYLSNDEKVNTQN